MQMMHPYRAGKHADMPRKLEFSTAERVKFLQHGLSHISKRIHTSKPSHMQVPKGSRQPHISLRIFPLFMDSLLFYSLPFIPKAGFGHLAQAEK